jgi:DNA-binding transcriptional LysR family regulator
VEELVADLQQEHVGKLKIGTTETYSRCLLPDLLLSFQAAYPSVKVSLNLANSEEIEKSLLNYKSDLGLVGVYKACPRFKSVSLLREKLVLIAHPSHPLAKNEAVSLKETIDYPFIIREKGSTTRKIILQAFSSLGIYPNTSMEATSSEFIKQWVTREKAVSVVAKSTVAEEERTGLIKTIPLSEDLYLNVAFVYLKEKESDRVIKTIKAFINYAKSWVAQNKFG